MNFSSPRWYPLAVGLSLLNVAGAIFAAVQGQPMHAGGHVLLATLCGAWARHLKKGPAPLAIADQLEDRLQRLEDDVGGLRQQLGEAQERLDFSERMLTRVRKAD
jgi:hypothetical protein